jgi:hypothetical protein
MLSDDILNHPIFDRSFDTEEDFNNIEAILKEEAGIIMPEKFTWEAPKKVATIFYKPVEDGLDFYSNELGISMPDIEDLYSEIHKKGFDVAFDDSVFAAEGVEKGFLSGAEKKQGKGFTRMLFDAYDPRPLDFANFFHFLKLAKKWRDNQDDWVLAYQFIETHPMFWSVSNYEKYPHVWRTDEGHSTLWVHATKNDKGEPVVMLEGGSSVPPHHNHHYHDHRIDVWGKNFEDAYIQFAKNIHRDYSLDGLHREDEK